LFLFVAAPAAAKARTLTISAQFGAVASTEYRARRGQFLTISTPG
jgi:hypothetical protein